MEKNVMETASKPGKRENTLIKVFDAPVERVWKAWTDPKIVKRWWGPEGFTAPYVSIDFHVGGKSVYCMRGPGFDGVVKDWWNTSMYLEIVPMNKIVQTMSFADEQGNPVPASYYNMPGDWPMETQLIVTFEDIGEEKTEVTVREEGIPEDMVEPSRLGWEQQFDKLVELLKE